MSDPNRKDFKSLTKAEMSEIASRTKSKKKKAVGKVVQDLDAKSSEFSFIKGVKVITPIGRQAIAAMEIFRKTHSPQSWNALTSLSRVANEDDLLAPVDRFAFSQRAAVFLRRPRVDAQSLSKNELQLAVPSATEVTFSGAVFSKPYVYSPSYTDPDQRVFLMVAAALEEKDMEVLRASARWCMIPPQLANMARKAKMWSTRDWGHDPVDPLILREADLKQLYSNEMLEKYLVPAGPPKPADKEGIEAWIESVADALADWFVYRFPGDTVSADSPSIMRDTSPGMPYLVTKPEKAAGWGRKHSPQFLEHFLGKDGVLRRFCSLLVRRTVRNLSIKPDVPSRVDKAFEIGAQLYNEISRSNVAQVDTGGSKPSDFWGHALFAVGPGNVKPVTLAEVADKPDRAIYMAPALLDTLGARIGYTFYDYVRNEWTIPHLAWAAGGAQRFVEKVTKDLQVRAEFQGLPRVPGIGGKTRRIVLPGCLVLLPDRKANDMTVHPEYMDQFTGVARRMFYSRTGDNLKPTAMSLAAAAGTGLFLEACKKPRMYWGNNVVSDPNNTLPSGARVTWSVNQTITGDVGLEMRKQLVRVYHVQVNDIDYRVEVLSLHSTGCGDDMAVFLQCAKVAIAVAGESGVAEVRQFWLTDDVQDPSVRPTFEAIKERFEGVICGVWKTPLPAAPVASGEKPKENWAYHGGNRGAEDVLVKEGLLHRVAARCKIVLKPETLRLFTSISDGTFLGSHLVASFEGLTDADEPFFVGARPLDLILHSAYWPKRQPNTKAGISPAIHSALRAVAAFMEGAVPYPQIRSVMGEIFAERVGAGAVPWESEGVKDTLDGLGDITLYGENPLSEVLEEVGWKFGHFPTIAHVWKVATGRAFPRLESAVEDSGSGPDLDYEDLDFDEGPSLAKRRPYRSGDSSSPHLLADDPHLVESAVDLEDIDV